MKSVKLHKIIKRVICVFLLSVSIFTALSMISSVVIFGVMFQRTDVITGFAELDYAHSGIDYARTRIYFDSGENKLSGYLYPAQNPKGLVIIAPGINSSCDSHLAEIMFFAQNGYSALAYDATGVCESEGDSRVGLQQSKRDLLAAVDYARNDSQLSALPVYLYGHSLGGYAVAAALGEADVEAAICLSGFDSPVQTMHGKAKEYIGVLADIEYPFLYLQNWFTFGNDADATAVESINSVDTPILICHGDNDETIPYDLSVYSHEDEITNSNASFLEVGGQYRDGHVYMWLSEESAKYMSEIQDEYRDLSDVYDGDIPQNVLDDFYSSVDPEKAMELDGEFMNNVLDFMQSAK